LSLLAILECYGHVSTNNNVDNTYLSLLCVGTVISSILDYIVNWIASTSSYTMAEDIIDKRQLDLAKHMKNLPMGFFCSRDPGDLSGLLIRDCGNVMTLLSMMLPQFPGSSFLQLRSFGCSSLIGDSHSVLWAFSSMSRAMDWEKAPQCSERSKFTTVGVCRRDKTNQSL
jgi:ABC-type multidrug transport system fused ATPase/permease subunit